MQKKNEIYDIGFINTNIIDDIQVKKHAEEAEANLLQSLIKNQNKDTILFPYNGKWVLLIVCIFGFPYYSSEVIVM